MARGLGGLAGPARRAHDAASRTASARMARPAGGDRGSGGPAPEVTVVVAAHERPALLELALRSVLAQQGVTWECVVVDDGSADPGVWAVAERVAQEDGRVRALRHPRPFGLAAARNTGTLAARAATVCYLDDDDHLCSGSLRRRFAALHGAGADVVGAYCDWVTVGPEDGLDHFVPLRRAARRADVDLLSCPWGAPFIATSPLLRRDPVLAAGGFNESMDRAEDAELWTRLLRSGHRFAYVPHVGVAYRLAPATMVGAAPADQLDRLEAVAAWLEAEVPVASLAPGPCREPWPLSKVKMRAEQQPSLVRYLGLVACLDPDDAVRRGRALLPASLRTAQRLAQWSADARRNCVRRGGVPEDAASAVVSALFAGLVAPEPWAAPSPGDPAARRPIGAWPGSLGDVVSLDAARVAAAIGVPGIG